MKNKITILLSVLLCLIMTVSLAACGEKDKQQTAAVTFLHADTGNKDVYEELAKKYKEEKGVEVKVVSVDKDNYSETLKKQLKKDDAPTVFELQGVRDFEQCKDYCTDLKNGSLYSALLDKEIAIKDGMNVSALPYSVTGIGILYNEEITQKYFSLADKKSPLSSMEEVTTYEQLKTVVQDMQAHKKELGIDGVFASLSLSEGEEDRFSYHLLGTPLYYEMKEKDGDVRDSLYGTERLKFKYADNYKDLFDLYADSAATEKKNAGEKTAEDSYREFALGKVAMMQGDSTMWSTLTGVKDHVLKADKVKMLPLYIGVEGEDRQGLNLSADGYFAVNKKAKDASRSASEDFLNWLFAENTGKKYVTTRLSYNVPFDTVADEERTDDPLMAETVRHIKNGAENVIMAIDRAFPDADYYKKMGASLRDYAAGRESFDTVKRTVTDEWKRPD